MPHADAKRSEGRRGAVSLLRRENVRRALHDDRASHRMKLHSVNPLERLNMDVKRKIDVVGLPQRSAHRPTHRGGVAGT